MSEGSTIVKRSHKAPTVKPKHEYEAEGWPKLCALCGRLTRPAHCKAADWPGTVCAENRDGECQRCVLGVQERPGMGRVRSTQKTPEEEERMIREARRDLERMWADRRARGINPDGIFFKGETPIRHTPATLPGDVTAEQSMGLCPSGHPYDKRDSLGHRRCSQCMAHNARGMAAVKAAKLAAAGELPEDDWAPDVCRRGHKLDSGKHCTRCRNEAQKLRRKRRREQALEDARQDTLAF